MPEKKHNVSPLKQKILAFIDDLGISKREFYAKTGISRGTLESATGFTEDTLAKFLGAYPNIDPGLLFFNRKDVDRVKEQNKGDGPDFLGNEAPLGRYGTKEENILLTYLREKDQVIQKLSERIGHLEAQIDELKKSK